VSQQQQNVHLMGIGGVGMAAVAELMLGQGLTVSGCDSTQSPRLEHLRGLGIPVHLGHDPAHLANTDCLVFSSAVRENNPELAEARRLGISVEHRSQALARIANSKRLIAVAGTHGKTTTSAMTVVALEAVGLAPSYAVGSELLGRGSGARLLSSGSDLMVIEADESDGSFLNYEPEVAVVTNVDADHLDHYKTSQAYEEAFRQFVGRLRQPGLLIACADDSGSRALGEWASKAACRQQVWFYGLGDGLSSAGLLGRHMALNAEAATLVAKWFGASPSQAAVGLAGFAGTARRFESLGEARGVRVFDDYAHHPAEIAATLAAAKQLAGEGHLLVIFQPHLYSRTQRLADEFARALARADRVWLLDIYGAREEPFPGVDSGLIAHSPSAGRVLWPVNRAQVVEEVARIAAPGDIVLTMGAGDVTELGPQLVAAL
jgi:UDP-N-acetylmuramate--alanine ligase